MKIEIVSFSDSKQDWYLDFTAEYLKKSGQFCQINRVSLGGVRSKLKKYKKEGESSIFLEYLSTDDFVIVCDESGQKQDSIAFSKKLNNWLGSSKKRMIFAIGGSFGWNEQVLQRADHVLSLSAMTMNHLLAEMVLAEQIYRAFSILNGHPYHNQ